MATLTKRPGGRVILDCSKDEFEGLFAAMVAMVLDIHAVQDTLLPEVWNAAEHLLKEMDQVMEEKT